MDKLNSDIVELKVVLSRVEATVTKLGEVSAKLSEMAQVMMHRFEENDRRIQDSIDERKMLVLDIAELREEMSELRTDVKIAAARAAPVLKGVTQVVYILVAAIVGALASKLTGGLFWKG